MNKKRFSDLELYTLRNNIPVQRVIKTVLNIPAETTHGYFRFQCPLCYKYNTAVNAKTNLARCFTCKKNFNTIDLVMICKKVGFVKSVAFLKNYGYLYCPKEKHTHTNINKPEKGIEKIGKIIDSMMKQINPPKVNHTEKHANHDRYEYMMKRIRMLEQKVEYLIRKINIILK